MSLALTILDGPLKGKMISLKKNYILSGDFFSDDVMSNQHAVVDIDSNLSWNISCLDENKIRVGLGETNKISLISGLVFHLGQTGFKVTDKPKLNFRGWESGLTDWISEQCWEQKQTDFFFFLYPIRMTFLSGPQSDEFFTISYGPRTMGFNSFDLNIKDPSQPGEILRFSQVGESAYIENLVDGLKSDKVLVNKNRFDHHPISDGDRIQFGPHLIELTILR